MNRTRFLHVSILFFLLLAFTACDDNDSGSAGPADQKEYINVYVVTTVDDKPPEDVLYVKTPYLPSMLNVRYSEEDSTFSGYVHIMPVGWLPISEIHSFPHGFSATAPDSLTDAIGFGFGITEHNAAMIKGICGPISHHIDYFSHTFTAMSRPVPADSVMNDEYYFAAGPGKTKVFVVESIGGKPPDSLPEEWGNCFPLLMELVHDDTAEAFFFGRVFFSRGGWIDIPRNNVYEYDFTVDATEELHPILGMYFYELIYEPPVLSGTYYAFGTDTEHHLPFISRRVIVSTDSLPNGD